VRRSRFIGIRVSGYAAQTDRLYEKLAMLPFATAVAGSADLTLMKECDLSRRDAPTLAATVARSENEARGYPPTRDGRLARLSLLKRSGANVVDKKGR
jgi:hypothetical protein